MNEQTFTATADQTTAYVYKGTPILATKVRIPSKIVKAMGIDKNTELEITIKKKETMD